ncbi:MAG: hypothetical protein GC166_01480 [Alphaproteobacteria bacterium]|nr:hypothetical protein [Alphaproteobacteria bacterium]
MTPKKTALALGLALSLTACAGVVGPPPAGTIYRLNPGLVAAAEHTAPVSWQLIVASPLAPQSLDTDRIALLQGPSVQDYYANAQWTDRAPAMVQSLLVEAFETDGTVKAVGREDSGIKANYILQSEMRDFEAQYDVRDTPPRVVVKLSMRLVVVPERTVLGTRTITKTVQAKANTLVAVTDAFSQAAGDAANEAVSWTLATVPALDARIADAPPEQSRRHRRNR